MKLWGGRFKKEINPRAEKFLSSISFDKRLFAHDIEGSLAHARMLTKAGLLTEEENKKISQGLLEIKEEISRGQLDLADKEDIHLAVEERLKEKIADAADKLHTARSRNDQVVLDVRLYLRDEVKEILTLLKKLQEAILEVAEKNIEAIMPGFTHLQHGQPVLFSHHLMAYFQMLKRDRGRFQDALESIDNFPLGAGALAGTSLPIDREYTAGLLGFSEISPNSVDAVSDRDFIVDFIYAAAVFGMHLSRLAEELVIWATPEFDFISVGEDFCTGSSLMPQKKNLDVAELARGKSARLSSFLVQMLMLLKGLPLAYNRDLQEDKQSLFAAVDTVKELLSVFSEMLLTLEVKKDNMLAAAQKGFLLATDLVEYLVKKGISFREAHISVGKMVRYAEEKNKRIEELSGEEMRAFSYEFGEDVHGIMNLMASVKAKKSYGGTSPENVSAAIAEAKKSLG